MFCSSSMEVSLNFLQSQGMAKMSNFWLYSAALFEQNVLWSICERESNVSWVELYIIAIYTSFFKMKAEMYAALFEQNVL